jgi:hypothetical protein
MAAKEEGEKRQKGWYRYRLVYGATRDGGHFEVEIILQKRNATELKDFSKEEAESILRQVGNYIANSADFKTLKEDF